MNDDFADGLALGYILRNNKSSGGEIITGSSIFNDYLAGPEMMMLPIWIDIGPFSMGGSQQYYYVSDTTYKYENTMDKRLFNAFLKARNVIKNYGSYPFAKINGQYVNVANALFINYLKGPTNIYYHRETRTTSPNIGTWDIYEETWNAYDPLDTKSYLSYKITVKRNIYIQINNAGEPDEYPSAMYVTRWFNSSSSDVDYYYNIDFYYSCARKIDIIKRLVLWTPETADVKADDWTIWMQSNPSDSGYPPFSSQWQAVYYEQTYLNNFK